MEELRRVRGGRKNCDPGECQAEPETPNGEESVKGLSLASNQEITKYERVHLCAQKAIECFLGTADNGLVVVKRSVQHDRDAGLALELGDQGVVTRIGFCCDRLQSAS